MADELSLFGAMLGEPDGQLGRLLEGMFTAQVTAALTRLGVPDQLAGGPLTAAELALRLGASADGLAGYHLVRDTPVTDVLPWRVLEFERA